MRKELLINEGWEFHKGDIAEPTSTNKEFIVSQSKTKRKTSGPAAFWYADRADSYVGGLLTTERWEHIDLPHDYVVYQDNNENENCALGYLNYDKENVIAVYVNTEGLLGFGCA